MAFPAAGAHVTSMVERRNRISAWYRGHGQINRVSGVWAPAWVGVDVVMYNPGEGVAFSVVWDDDGEAIRHIIDYTRIDAGSLGIITRPLG